MKNHPPTIAEKDVSGSRNQDLDSSDQTDLKPTKSDFLLLERLHYLSQATHAAESIENLLTELKIPLLNIFDAENVTIFVIDKSNKEIYSKEMTEGKITEIRLPLSRKSIAGFVCVDKKLLNIVDVQNQKALTAIHPDLKFDAKWDAISEITTKSILAVPLIYDGQPQGVLELVNKTDGSGFNATDENNAFLAGETLALALHNLQKLSPRRTQFSYLTDCGLVCEKDIVESFATARQSGISVEDVLMENFNLSREQVGTSLADYYDIPYQGYDSEEALPDPEVLGLDLNVLREQEWIPIQYNDSGITVLLTHPANKTRMEKIRKCFPSQEVSFRLGLSSDLNDYFNSLFDDLDPEDNLDYQYETEESLSVEVGREGVEIIKSSNIKAVPSTQSTLNNILSAACDHAVTDIHIEPAGENNPALIRLRKDGVCRIYSDDSDANELIREIKTLANLNVGESKKPQSGSFSWKKDSQSATLEVVLFPTIGNVEDAILKVVSIGKSTPVLKSLDDLNLSEPNLELVSTALKQKSGFILAVGEPGTGKTTLLHAILNRLNNTEKKILTAENPVEIIQPGIRQMNIDLDSGLDTTSALQLFIKGSPDVILAEDVSEEQDTFQLAMEVAARNLFLASINTGSVCEALEKIKILSTNRSDLPLSLILFLQPVNTLCDDCKTDYHPSRDEYDQLAQFYGEQYFGELGLEYTDDLMLKKAEGCRHCLQSGYKGRTLLQEVWNVTPAIRKLILSDTDFDALQKQAVKDGMIGAHQDAIYKVFKGDCDFKQIQSSGITGTH